MTDTARIESDDENRRGEHRESIENFFVVFDAADGSKLGALVDLSDSGMRIASNCPLEEGQRFEVNVQRVDKSGESQSFCVTVEARWSREGASDGLYYVGFRIVDMTPVQRMALKIMVANFVTLRSRTDARQPARG